MNTFNDVKLRVLPDGVWVDIKVKDISEIHRASLLGGRFVVYQLYDGYRMCFTHESVGVTLNFYGLRITEQQYEFQIYSWGDDFLEVRPGTELLLADNLYFI
jgi:hypothetical protein